MRREASLLGGLLLAALSTTPVRADVIDVKPDGFEVRQTVTVKGTAPDVYDVMVHPARWWSKDHTYSHDAKKMALSPSAGGCLCEQLNSGGSVRHMSVIYADPGKRIVLEGAMGPLASTGASGHLQWDLSEKAGMTTITWTYDVGGYAKGGLDAWAKPVDGMLTETIARLKKTIEIGRPD